MEKATETELGLIGDSIYVVVYYDGDDEIGSTICRNMDEVKERIELPPKVVENCRYRIFTTSVGEFEKVENW